MNSAWNVVLQCNFRLGSKRLLHGIFDGFWNALPSPKGVIMTTKEAHPLG